MGLIYNPTESGELVSNFNANITACEQIISDLKTGNSHLVFALNSKLLSGAAFNAGLSMFSQLVNPTVDKVDASIQELKTKLQQYTQYTDAAGSEILDEDKLNEQLDELNRQQAMVSSQIRFYQNQARLNDSPELTAMCYNHASELNSYMSTIYEDIRKVEEKLKKLHELDMKIAPLFSGIASEFSKVSTIMSVLGSGNFDSNGKFRIENNKNKKALLDILSDYGSGAVQDGLSEGIGKFLETMDIAMPNAGSYMRAFSGGNKYWTNASISWDGVGYGKALSTSLFKKGVQNVTVKDFGIGKAKISGLGTLGFGIDYLQNRADGESVGMAFTHTAATTVVTSAGIWAVGATASAAAAGAFGTGAIATAGTAVSVFIASNPVGWAIGAGIVVGGLTKLAYDSNFLGFQDGVKTVGKALNSGINKITSIFGWGKNKHA